MGIVAWSYASESFSAMALLQACGYSCCRNGHPTHACWSCYAPCTSRVMDWTSLCGELLSNACQLRPQISQLRVAL